MAQRLTTRVQTLETMLRPDDALPRFQIVLEDEEGVWHDGHGNTIDPATVRPWLRIIRLVPHLPPTPGSSFDALDP